MRSAKILLLCFTLLNIIVKIQSLVELTTGEDNSIAIAETAIRNTVNKLFTNFKIQESKHKSRLKQFSAIHNFFVSITLTDCDNLKKITQLTRVTDIDNNTQHFITLVNEVLNEGDKSNEVNDNLKIYIESFIERLKYLKETYVSDKNNVVNEGILKYLDNKGITLKNVSDENNSNNSIEGNILSDNDFWQPSGRRIYNGIRSRIKKFAFMASVQFFKKFQCAGSIIKDDLVITSSSCLQLSWNNRFFRENPAFLSVQVGSDFYESGGENIAVLEIYFHPSYNPKTLMNNLAIMRLTRKIAFRRNQKRVKKIDIDRDAAPLSSLSQRITVVGWGARDSSNMIYNVMRNKLSYALLEFYPLNECQDHYSKDFVTYKNFCAGFYSKGGGACNRDAGGPGVIDGTLMGVISFGSPVCGTPDSPTVFTKLGFYADWIDNIMQQDVLTGYQTTTELPPRLSIEYYIHTYPSTTELRVTPIGKDFKPAGVNKANFLREAQDRDFNDFLTNVFESKEGKDYVRNTEHDEIHFEARDSGNETTEEDSKETDEEVETTTVAVEPITTTSPTATPINTTTVSTTSITTTTTTTFGTSTRIPFVTNVAVYLPTTENVSTTIIENDSIDLSNETDISREESSEDTTKPERKVTRIIKYNSNERKTLEENIMNIIDNLDIDGLFNQQNNTNVTKEKFNRNTDVETVETDSRALNESYESDETSYSEESTSEKVDRKDFNGSSLMFSYLSDEINDEEGLSIPGEPINDLTFRQNNDTHDGENKEGLSESAMIDLISKAIDEEAKRLMNERGTLP